MSSQKKGGSGIADEFFYPTTTATEDLTLRIPKGKWQHFVLRRTLWLSMFAFGILGAAVFAEPAVTEIEEVVSLGQGSGGKPAG